VIESAVEHVPLVGMAIRKLCSLVGMSEEEALQIELCVVEAVTNSIEHAYLMRPGEEVEVVFTLSQEELVLEVRDRGISLDRSLLERNHFPAIEFDPSDLEHIPERGRGLALIKQIMDIVSYRTVNGRNCLTMKKRLLPSM